MMRILKTILFEETGKNPEHEELKKKKELQRGWLALGLVSEWRSVCLIFLGQAREPLGCGYIAKTNLPFNLPLLLPKSFAFNNFAYKLPEWLSSIFNECPTTWKGFQIFIFAWWNWVFVCHFIFY